MKPILLFLAGLTLAFQAEAQTVITGPVMNGDGSPANCTLTIRPLGFLGISAATVQYVVVGGDLSGTVSGYGPSARSIRRGALQLFPGVYSAFQSCTAGLGSHTFTWDVPNTGSVSLAALNGGLPVIPQPPGSGTYCLTAVNGTYGSWGACGSAPSFATWDLLTSAWDSYTAGWDTYH